VLVVATLATTVGCSAGQQPDDDAAPDAGVVASPDATPLDDPAPASPEPSSGPEASTLAVASEELLGIGGVIEDENGTVLCLGPVMTSLPPQCDGPDLVGWDWSEIRPRHTRAGTTWTDDHVVVGTFDGHTFTLTRPAVSLREYDGPRSRRAGDRDGHRLDTPCARPVGGWHVVDPATTTERSLLQLNRAAHNLPGFADLWWDQSPNEKKSGSTMNDPTGIIVNVRVRGDVVAAEAHLRRVWGGALCVTEARRSAAELRRITRRLRSTPGLQTMSSGRDVVDLEVLHDDGSLQRRVDRRYGRGVVRVHSALVPVSELEG
jgi:hypothetical protein